MSTTNRMDRLERITNTLLENITYFTVFESEDTDDIMIELHTIYDGMQHFGEAISGDLDTAKRNACRKIAEKIVNSGANVKEEIVFTNDDYLCSFCGKPYTRIVRATSKNGKAITIVTCDSDTCDYAGIADEMIPMPENRKT